VGEGILAFFGDEGMQVVPEKIGAVHAAMAVEDSEVGWLLPVGCVFGLRKIEDDGHSVFVVLAYWPLVGGGRVCPNGAMSILGMLGGFKIADRHKHFRQLWMFVLMSLDASFLNIVALGLYEDFFSDDLIYVSCGGF
jgi:hypothetical protein